MLRGRLDDAVFTFERDAAVGIDALAERLSDITFFAGAGSFADKTERLVGLVGELGGDDVAIAAARLAKADQASELVREFPGAGRAHRRGVRALAGQPEPVCVAIDEQYLLDAADAPSRPRSPRRGACSPLVDKLGYAISPGRRLRQLVDRARRAAIGVCRLALEGGLSFRIDDPTVRDFVEERLESVLDVPVEAVRPAAPGSTTCARSRSSPASSAGCRTIGWGPCTRRYTRASRIVGDKADDAPVNRILLREEAERDLAEALDAFEPMQGELEADFAAAAALAPTVERFFEDVLVMDPGRGACANRLRPAGRPLAGRAAGRLLRDPAPTRLLRCPTGRAGVSSSDVRVATAALAAPPRAQPAAADRACALQGGRRRLADAASDATPACPTRARPSGRPNRSARLPTTTARPSGAHVRPDRRVAGKRTPAIVAAKRAGITYRVHEYVHDGKAADALADLLTLTGGRAAAIAR